MVRLKYPMMYQGRYYEADDIMSLPDDLAKKLIDNGNATEVIPSAPDFQFDPTLEEDWNDEDLEENPDGQDSTDDAVDVELDGETNADGEETATQTTFGRSGKK